MNIPIKLYVSQINEIENSGTYAFEFEIKRILKNIFTIFNNRDATDFIKEAMLKSEGLAYMHRFYQYIVYFHLKHDLQNGSIVFFDCKNDIDIALDMHLNFTKNSFDKLAKEEFMKEFLALQTVYDSAYGLAILTTEELPPID